MPQDQKIRWKCHQAWNERQYFEVSNELLVSIGSDWPNNTDTGLVDVRNICN